MGASSWFYQHTWDGTVGDTLGAAQTAYLASEDCLDVLPSHDELVASAEDLLMMVEIAPEVFDGEAIQGALDRLAADGRPATRDDAVLLCAQNLGTMTVLDADSVRDEARGIDAGPTPWGHEGLFLSPLPPDDLVQIFGTAQPTSSQVEAERESLRSMGLFRQDGRYVIGFDDGVPASVAFFGWSGD